MQTSFYTRHACVGVGGATESLTRGLALDLAPIRVNTVIPGAVFPCSALRLHCPMSVMGVKHLAQQLAAIAQIFASVQGWYERRVCRN